MRNHPRQGIVTNCRFICKAPLTFVSPRPSQGAAALPQGSADLRQGAPRSPKGSTDLRQGAPRSSQGTGAIRCNYRSRLGTTLHKKEERRCCVGKEKQSPHPCVKYIEFCGARCIKMQRTEKINRAEGRSQKVSYYLRSIAAGYTDRNNYSFGGFQKYSCTMRNGSWHGDPSRAD